MTRCDICDTVAKARPIQRKGWRLLPDYAVHNGKHAPLTPQEALLLYVLARDGGCVPAYTLGMRITHGSHPEGDPANRAKTVASRIRRKIPNAPFENVRYAGYRWTECVLTRS